MRQAEFKYKADMVPTLVIVSLTLADFFIYFNVNSIWLMLSWYFLTLWPKACICSWNHHHQHVPTFKQNWANRLLEISYGLHTGISTNAWVLHHNLGHHVNYLDQTKDESGWMSKDGKTMGVIRYTLTIALTGYTRAYQVGKNYPRFQKPFLSMGFFLFLLTAALIIYRPIPGLLVFALPMLTGYVITCWHTYYHHAGLHTDNHHEASYNIMHKWYNIMTGNLGYHTAHHMKQALHWSLLPAYHETIKDKIPAELYRPPCVPFTLLPKK